MRGRPCSARNASARSTTSADGVYICCAHAALQWRCEQCAKVSEGFAFPYGRCPQCGGKLVVQDGPPARPGRTLEGIRTAFEIELGGRAFYQRAAADSADPELKQLFGRFALMEGEHMETLSRRYHLDVPLPSPEFRREVAAIFAGVEDRPQDPANLFRIAIGLEQRAAQFFGARAAGAAEDSAEQRLYRELAAEEREHASMLATEYERWRGGKPGLFSVDLLGPARARQRGAATRPRPTPPRVLLADADAQRTRTGLRRRPRSATASCASASARAAALWRARGIQPGDRIAIKLPDGIDWVTAFLGAMWAGAVAVPVNPRVPAPEWQYILDEAGFSVILAEAGDDTPAPWRARTLQVEDFRRGVAAAAPVAAAPGASRDAPAFWCHSSGTSGKPKAVVHAHRFARAHRTGVARSAGHPRRRPPVRQLEAVLLLPADQQPVGRPEARRHA